MVRIAVVEDDCKDAERLQRYLTQYADESGEQISSFLFTDGDELLENYNPPFDIILMDVQMAFMDGMATAEEIRKLDREVIIIFITNMAQYAIRGYAVDALDYMLKPVSYFAFSEGLKKAIERLGRRTRNYITVTVKGGAKKFDVNGIYYVESFVHNIVFHTEEGLFTSSGKISDAEQNLVKYNFFRCNKGCVVNLEHVDSVLDNCAIINGERLPISRSRKSEFMRALGVMLSKI